ncbi:MAG: phage tail tape measure protein, partial [Pseudomonas sp.]|nr:phage tail tape measure protein [Pseudomonas sp.]
MATELAKAYVQIIPSAQGIQGSISDVLGGEADSAGKESGKKYASGLGSSLKKALVGVGIAKILKDAIGNASEFETAMAKTSTLFTGDAKAFSALKNEILGLSSEYGLAATTLAEAAYSAESAGVKAEQLGPMLEGSARLAVAGFTDIDTALSATAKTMNAYGDAAMSAEDIQKVLIQTQNLGITTVGELGASLANVTPTAAAMGVGFDQVGAAMAQMTASGVQTAQATTQLRAAMTELGKSGTKADQAFREAAKGTQYAGMSFQEAQAAGANLGDVFGLMQKYADATGVSMVDLWGSVEAGNAAMLIASDVETFNSNLEAMATDADVVGDAYNKMADTFGTSMNKLKESAKNFMTTLFEGGDIATAFDNMLGSLGDVGEKLKTWLTTGLKTLGENLPKLVASLWDFGAGILQSLAEVDWIDLGTTIINGIIGGLGTLGTKLIELVGKAVTAVATGDIKFGEIGQAIWNGVTSVITTAGDWLKTLFEKARDAICGENGTDFSNIGKQILSGVGSILDSAGQFLAKLFGFGRDAAAGDDMNYKSIGEKILSGVQGVLDAGGKFLGDLFDKGLEAAADRPWPTVGDAIKTGVNLALNAGNFLAEVFSAGAELVKAINWENVGQHVEGMIVAGLDGASELVTTVANAADRLITSIGWESIGQSITELLNAGLNGATTLVQTVTDASARLISSIGWESIGQSITNLINAGLNGAALLI